MGEKETKLRIQVSNNLKEFVGCLVSVLKKFIFISTYWRFHIVFLVLGQEIVYIIFIVRFSWQLHVRDERKHAHTPQKHALNEKTNWNTCVQPFVLLMF